MERKKIPFNAKIKFVEKINDEFLKCKVYVCALGKNRNLSYISRSAADDALYSLYNIPVIGHLYEDENGDLHMGGHDMKIEQNADGKYIWKSICVPYGVLPSQDNVHYEDIKEPNGDIKTYVVADCILWVGRFPELAEAAYSDDWLFNQSMEINVNEYAPLDEDKNYTNILNYTYSALCLLGKSDNQDYNTEPCFPEAKVSLAYELDNDKFALLMEELRKDLANVFSGKDDGKEEKTIMTQEVRDSILNEFAIKLDELDFAVSDDMTEEEFRAKLNEFVKKGTEDGGNAIENPDDTATDDGVTCAHTFTYREKAEALTNAMPNSENVYYWMCDFDDKYAYVERSSYDANGHYSEERGRFEYSYDEANKTATVIGDFEPMVVKWLTKDEDAAIDVMRGQYEELMAYKTQRENKDRENEIDEAIKQFADLTGNEEFDAIVSNKYSYQNVEALMNACYIVRGKYGITPKAHKNTEPSVPVGGPREETTLRDKFHEAYGRR